MVTGLLLVIKMLPTENCSPHVSFFKIGLCSRCLRFSSRLRGRSSWCQFPEQACWNGGVKWLRPISSTYFPARFVRPSHSAIMNFRSFWNFAMKCRISEVPGWDPSPETCQPDKCLSRFSSVPLEKCIDIFSHLRFDYDGFLSDPLQFIIY